MRDLFLGFVLALTTVCIGCGNATDGSKSFPVTGTVLFEGTPIEEGQVVFRSADGNGHSFAGSIKDGKFSFDSTEGFKQVEITAYKNDEIGKAESGPIPEVTLPAKKAYIPEKYNRKTTLSVTVTSIDKNYFEFDLTP